MLPGKAKGVVAAAASAVLAACAGLGNVRAGDKAWLEKCPPAHRKVVADWGLHLPAAGWLQAGDNAIRHDTGGVELRDGRVEVEFLTESPDGFVGGRLYGQARTGPDGASIQLTQARLYVDEKNLAPRLYDICAIVSVIAYGHRPGIPSVASPERPERLHAGYVFVTTRDLDVHFAR